jgi:hypothetical protein
MEQNVLKYVAAAQRQTGGIAHPQWQKRGARPHGRHRTRSTGHTLPMVVSSSKAYAHAGQGAINDVMLLFVCLFDVAVR